MIRFRPAPAAPRWEVERHALGGLDVLCNAALVAMKRGLAGRHAAGAIRFNVVSPSLIATPHRPTSSRPASSPSLIATPMGRSLVQAPAANPAPIVRRGKERQADAPFLVRPGDQSGGDPSSIWIERRQGDMIQRVA